MKAAIRSGSSVQFKGLKPFGKSFLGKFLNNFSFASSGFSVDLQGIKELDGGESYPLGRCQRVWCQPG
jgi:hypothetical protein